MSTDLLSLSTELHQRIVDFILPPNDENGETEEEKRERGVFQEEEDDQRASTEHLIPQELKALIKLSCTCSFYRNLAGSRVYRKLYLTNTEASGASLLAVAAGPFRDAVTELLFVGRAAGSEEDDFEDVDKVLPQEVEDVLMGLHNHFPKLQSLNIGFAFDLNLYDKWDIYAYEDFMEVEDDETIATLEEEQGFRSLMAKVWKAIARNSYTPKHLKMRHFVPKLVTPYSSSDLHAFLSKVEKFEISIWGSDNGAGWVSNTGDGYLDAITKLDRIFGALTSCTDFTFEASQYGWVGLEGFRHTTMPLRPEQMPLLKRLSLRHCFVSPELVSFVNDHKNTLEDITMRDCGAVAAEGSAMAENPVDWSVLFSAMTDLKALKRVEVLPEDIPYSYKMTLGEDTTLKEDDEDVEKVRSELENSEGKRRMFAYGNLDDKYGHWSLYEDMCRKEFWKGTDQKTWNELLVKVRKNNKQQSTVH